MNDFFAKTGDTANTITATLRDAADAAVDVTGATVLFRCSGPTGPLSGTCTLVTPASGIVSYAPVFTQPGSHSFEFEVTFSNGTIQTFPTNGQLEVIVQDDI